MPRSPFPEYRKERRPVKAEAFRTATTWSMRACACILEHANGARWLFLDARENKALLGRVQAFATTGFETCIETLPRLYLQLQRT